MKCKHKSWLKLLSLTVVLALLCLSFASCSSDKKESSSLSGSAAQTSGDSTDQYASDIVADESGTDVNSDGETVNSNDTESGTSGSGTASKNTTGNQTSSTGKTNSTSSSGGSSSSQRTLAKDNIVDMNGYSFTIMSVFLPTSLSKNSTLFEEQLFERIDEVQKQYNCKIKIIQSPYPDLNTIKKYVLANRKFADILELPPRDMVGAAELGYITSWDGVSPINTNDARWIEQGVSLGKYNNKQYGLSFYRPPEVRSCIVMNKTLLKANGIDPNSIYDAVNKGTWNFDMLRSLAVKCTNNSKKTYGIIGYPDYMADGLMKANNAKLVTRQSNGKAAFTGSSNAAVTAMQYLYDLVNTNKCVYIGNATLGTDSAWDAVYRAFDPVTEFLKGNYAFMLHESWTINQKIKSGAQKTNMEYGMIPYPKGPNATQYYSSASNARLFCRTSSNKDYQKSAIIFNALARPLDDIVDYYDDVQADYFQSNDSKSLEMYKLLLANSTYDIGEAVSELGNAFNAQTATSVYAHTTTVKAGLEAMNGTYDSAINAIFNRK